MICIQSSGVDHNLGVNGKWLNMKRWVWLNRGTDICIEVMVVKHVSVGGSSWETLLLPIKIKE